MGMKVECRSCGHRWQSQVAVSAWCPICRGTRVRARSLAGVVFLVVGGVLIAVMASCCLWMKSVTPQPRAARTASPRPPVVTASPDAGVEEGDPTPGTLCGHADALEGAVSLPSWSSYRCRSAAERCLARSEYTHDRGHGCPGEMQCCPPTGQAAGLR